MKLQDRRRIDCSDYDLTRQEEIDLVRRAMVAFQKMSGRLTITDEIALECALDSYVNGDEKLRSCDQADLDAIENRLGIIPVWIDPEQVWIRHRGSSDQREDWDVRPVSLGD